MEYFQFNYIENKSAFDKVNEPSRLPDQFNITKAHKKQQCVWISKSLKMALIFQKSSIFYS